MARGVVLAATGRSEGGPAVLRDWIGTWRWSRTRRRCSGRRGPKKPELGQQLPQPCPRKLRPIALAEVLTKLTESCVIEHHNEKLLKVVEPTNWGLGTPDAAALIVRILRGLACDMAAAPKLGSTLRPWSGWDMGILPWR